MGLRPREVRAVHRPLVVGAVELDDERLAPVDGGLDALGVVAGCPDAECRPAARPDRERRTASAVRARACLTDADDSLPDALPGVAVDHADERGRRLGFRGLLLLGGRGRGAAPVLTACVSPPPSSPSPPEHAARRVASAVATQSAPSKARLAEGRDNVCNRLLLGRWRLLRVAARSARHARPRSSPT